MSNELATQQKTTLKSLLASTDVSTKMKEILGKRSSTFATSVLQIANQNSMLARAEPKSILGAAMTAATLDLPLNNNLGYAYIVPFNEKQKDGNYQTKAQFMLGYKGFVQLAMRSGQFKTLNSTDVKEGEIGSRDRLSGTMEFSWIDNDTERAKAKTIGYVAYFKLNNGFDATYYMSVEELEAHGKKFSQTFKKGFGLWKDDFDNMSKKTVLKLLLSKQAPLSIDMQTAVTTDQAVVNDMEGHDVTYIDNIEEVNVMDEKGKKGAYAVAEASKKITERKQPLTPQETYEIPKEFKEVKMDKFQEELTEVPELESLKEQVKELGLNLPKGRGANNIEKLKDMVANPDNYREKKEESTTTEEPTLEKDDTVKRILLLVATSNLDDSTKETVKTKARNEATSFKELCSIEDYLKDNQTTKEIKEEPKEELFNSNPLVDTFRAAIQGISSTERPFAEQQVVRRAFDELGIRSEEIKAIVFAYDLAADEEDFICNASIKDLIKLVEEFSKK
jgi:recombination protein RecT